MRRIRGEPSPAKALKEDRVTLVGTRGTQYLSFPGLVSEGLDAVRAAQFVMVVVKELIENLMSRVTDAPVATGPAMVQMPVAVCTTSMSSRGCSAVMVRVAD